MGLTYLALLCVSIAGVAAIDRRWRLAYWRDRTSATVSIAVGVSMLFVLDLVCVALGIFRSAPSPWATGWFFLPGIPLEEPFFLVLLSYCTIVGARVAELASGRTR